VRVYRIARVRYAALDGEGARLVGGRWNSVGVPVVYTALTRALAVLESLVHADPDLVPPDLTTFEIDVPDGLAEETVDRDALPADWRRPGHLRCVELGDTWFRRGGTPLLRVPSAVVPEEMNLLINPRHRDAARVEVISSAPFAFDARLL
jgi:RES domain-containing protein